MEIFWRLLLGHMVGDFILQTGRIARAKTHSWQGLLLHVALVTAAMAAATINVLSWQWWLLLGLGHLLIDSARTFLIKNPGRWGWLYVLIDQTVHLLFLWGVTQWSQPTHHPMGELLHPTPIEILSIYAISVIFLIWTVPVLEVQVYAALTHIGEQINSSYLPITRRDRLMGAVERLSGLLLLMTPLAALVPLIFLPNYWQQWQNKRARPVQRLAIPSISLLSTLFIGYIFRHIPLHIPTAKLGL